MGRWAKARSCRACRPWEAVSRTEPRSGFLKKNTLPARHRAKRQFQRPRPEMTVTGSGLGGEGGAEAVLADLGCILEVLISFLISPIKNIQYKPKTGISTHTTGTTNKSTDVLGWHLHIFSPECTVSVR